VTNLFLFACFTSWEYVSRHTSKLLIGVAEFSCRTFPSSSSKECGCSHIISISAYRTNKIHKDLDRVWEDHNPRSVSRLPKSPSNASIDLFAVIILRRLPIRFFFQSFDRRRVMESVSHNVCNLLHSKIFFYSFAEHFFHIKLQLLTRAVALHGHLWIFSVPHCDSFWLFIQPLKVDHASSKCNISFASRSPLNIDSWNHLQYPILASMYATVVS
jgi:hypothetical protein